MFSDKVAQYIAVTMIGGAVSEAAGGDFLEGAVAAAMVHLFNDSAKSIREKLAYTARKYEGSKMWAYEKTKGVFPANTNKCNLFVFDMFKKIGINLALQDLGFFRYIPLIGEENMPYTAGQWADRNFNIPGFAIVNSAQTGDIIAIAHDYSDATGHVGIVTGIGLTTSQSSITNSVDTSSWGFRRNDGTPTIRRYIGN